jgi:hypothetical protein
MAYGMRKPPMRLVVSIVAVLLVAVAVPISTAIADGMNNMIGGGDKTIKKFDSLEDFNDRIRSNAGIIDPNKTGHVIYMHNYGETQVEYASQLLVTKDQNGQNYNEVVISCENIEIYPGKTEQILFSLDYSPSKWIDDGASYIEFSIATDGDKPVFIQTGDYYERTEGSGNSGKGLWFCVKRGSDVDLVSIPVIVTATDSTHISESENGYTINLTNELRTYRIEPANSVDLLRAQNFANGADDVSMVIALYSIPGDVNDIVNGEYYRFSVSLYGKQVSGYAMGNIVVGIIGISLIVGAVFATPWVGKNTFSKDGSVRRAGRRVKDYAYEWNYRRRNYDSKDWAAYKVQKRIDKQKRRESRQRRW